MKSDKFKQVALLPVLGFVVLERKCAKNPRTHVTLLLRSRSFELAHDFCIVYDRRTKKERKAVTAETHCVSPADLVCVEVFPYTQVLNYSAQALTEQCLLGIRMKTRFSPLNAVWGSQVTCIRHKGMKALK